MAKKVGTLIDQLGKLRERKRDADAKAKEIAELYNAKEKEVFLALKAENQEGGIGRHYKCSISKQIHPSVTDWDKLYAYIKRTNSWDLLQRRASSAAYNERLENGKKIPGVEPFTKIRLNLREA